MDFVALPIALKLENTSGTVTTVEGLPATGLDTICSGLTAQTAKDGAGWSSLIVKNSAGANLRALSPNSGITMNSSLFSTYFDSYVQQVWSKYSSASLTIDTQASWGSVNGTVSNNVLSFGSSVGSFTAPTSANIFSCSSGPFATSTAEMGAIGARLAAAFNRSTLMIDTVQPDDEAVADYYTNPITNHYARLLHATYLDGIGYAFPYDDVAPTGGADQSGSLYDANPQLLTVTVGGPGATAQAIKVRDHATRRGQRPAGRKQRRDAVWLSAEDEKRMLVIEDEEADEEDDANNSADLDLEKGLGRGKQAPFANTPHGQDDDGKGGDSAVGSEETPSSSFCLARSLNSLVPTVWAQRGTALLERLERTDAMPWIQPAVALVVRLIMLLLSVSVRTLISRVSMAIFLVLFYFILPLISTDGTATVGGGSAA